MRIDQIDILLTVGLFIFSVGFGMTVSLSLAIMLFSARGRIDFLESKIKKMEADIENLDFHLKRCEQEKIILLKELTSPAVRNQIS